MIQTLDDAGHLVSERMIVASGGNANSGAPSNNFAGQQEQPYSAAILEVDLTALAAMPVLTDPISGRSYVYDTPTLDDPTRDGAQDAGDPFGGHDGLNSAKLLADGPVRIYSPGYRNAYDVEVTEDGRVFTYDKRRQQHLGRAPRGRGRRRRLHDGFRPARGLHRHQPQQRRRQRHRRHQPRRLEPL